MKNEIVIKPKFNIGDKIKLYIPSTDSEYRFKWEYDWDKYQKLGYIDGMPSIENGEVYYFVKFYSKNNKKRTFSGGFSGVWLKEKLMELVPGD